MTGEAGSGPVAFTPVCLDAFNSRRFLYRKQRPPVEICIHSTPAWTPLQGTGHVLVFHRRGCGARTAQAGGEAVPQLAQPLLAGQRKCVCSEQPVPVHLPGSVN